jgi:hypothetical protein
MRVCPPYDEIPHFLNQGQEEGKGNERWPSVEREKGRDVSGLADRTEVLPLLLQTQ